MKFIYSLLFIFCSVLAHGQNMGEDVQEVKTDTIEFFDINSDGSTWKITEDTAGDGELKVFNGIDSFYFDTGYDSSKDIARRENVDAAILAANTRNYFQYVDDQYTQASPLVVAADVWTTLPNNAATIIKNVGSTESDYYNNNELVASSIDELYMIRVDFNADSQSLNNYLTLGIDIGDGTPIQIFAKDMLFARGLNVSEPFTETFLYYTKATFLSNGGKLIIKGDATFQVYDIAFLITKL